jgi:hypothetical protein
LGFGKQLRLTYLAGSTVNTIESGAGSQRIYYKQCRRSLLFTHFHCFVGRNSPMAGRVNDSINCPARHNERGFIN